MTAAKAYAALVGAICTALLGVFAADSTVGKILTVASVIATAVATYRVPNRPRASRNEAGASTVELAVIVTLILVVLMFFGVHARG